jgi:hypothetical protein
MNSCLKMMDSGQIEIIRSVSGLEKKNNKKQLNIQSLKKNNLKKLASTKNT